MSYKKIEYAIFGYGFSSLIFDWVFTKIIIQSPSILLYCHNLLHLCLLILVYDRDNKCVV